MSSRARSSTAVYLRVRDDYQKRQRALDEQSQSAQAGGARPVRAAARLLERFEADHEAVKLDQQELELRHKLGEFDDKEFQRRDQGDRGRGQGQGRSARARAGTQGAFRRSLPCRKRTRRRAVTGAGNKNAIPARRSSSAALGADDLAVAEARTHEVPSVGGNEPPSKTQVMPAHRHSRSGAGQRGAATRSSARRG